MNPNLQLQVVPTNYLVESHVKHMFEFYVSQVAHLKLPNIKQFFIHVKAQPIYIKIKMMRIVIGDLI